MNDPHLEDHAVGLELQMTEVAERLERARVQGRDDDVRAIAAELDELREELAATAESITEGHWDRPAIH